MDYDTAYISVFLLFAISGAFAAFFIVSELAVRAWVAWWQYRQQPARTRFFMRDVK